VRDGGYLLFSDPNANTIYSWSPDDGLAVSRAKSGYPGIDIGEYGQPGSNGLTLDREGRLTIDEHGNRRVTRLEKNGVLTVLADRFEGKRLNSPNDLVYKSDGALYFTDPPFGLPRFHEDPRKELPYSGVFRYADGRLSLAVDRGTISNLVLEVIGLDAGEAVLIFATRGDREIPVHCAVADLAVEKGIAATNVLVLDTPDTIVVGTGVIDLRNETLDLTLYPRPKDKSFFAARSPLHVRGPLRNPRVQPDAASLAARGLGAAALALVNPLLALLPFIETGPGKDSDCARMVARARDWSRPPPEARATTGGSEVQSR